MSDTRKRPKWFDYIRVRQRTILGTNKPPDFLVSFGPRNICVPKSDPLAAERLCEDIKFWLETMMQSEAVNG